MGKTTARLLGGGLRPTQLIGWGIRSLAFGAIDHKNLMPMPEERGLLLQALAHLMP